MCRKAEERRGAISMGPSASACSNTLIPPVRAIRSMSMSTVPILCQNSLHAKIKNVLTYFGQCLEADWFEGVLRILGHCNHCPHDGIREGDCAGANGRMRGMSFRSYFDYRANELDDLLLFYSMLVVTRKRPARP